MRTALKAAMQQTVNQVRQALNKAGDDERKKSDKIADGLLISALDAIADISDSLAEVAADAGNLWLAEVRLPDRSEMFDRVNARAVRYAKERGAELVSGIDDATRDEMAILIAKGLEDNIGMDEIASRIEDAYAFSDDRAELIAQTEIAFANQNGVLEGMKEAKDSGVSIKKVWLPDAAACDECQDNGDVGPIDLDDLFPTGDDAPPAHPNCRCTIASEMSETQDSEES